MKKLYSLKKIALCVCASVIISLSSVAQQTVNLGPGSGHIGIENINIGGNAGKNLKGNLNTNLGYWAGENLTDGTNNTNIGRYAGQNSGSGKFNSIFGDYAGRNITGNNNAVFGSQAGYTENRNLTSEGNSIFGFQAGKQIESGPYNTCVGYNAGASINNNGTSNTIIGAFAGYIENSSTNVQGSTILGAYAGRSSSGYNTILGYKAGNFQRADLGNNICLGAFSGNHNSSDIGIAGSVYVGAYAGSNLDSLPRNMSERSVFVLNNQVNLRHPLLFGLFAKNTAPGDPAHKPNSIAQLGINTHELIDSTSLTVAGAVHIGPAEIDPKAFKYDTLTNHYLLWVEKGVVSEDYAIAKVKDWKDNVFADTYNLPSLESVDAYIQSNKHLPEIPSEAEVLKRGYSMLDMDKRFLQKIEELTLYVIDQQKQMKLLQTELAELKRKKKFK